MNITSVLQAPQRVVAFITSAVAEFAQEMAKPAEFQEDLDTLYTLSLDERTDFRKRMLEKYSAHVILSTDARFVFSTDPKERISLAQMFADSVAPDETLISLLRFVAHGDEDLSVREAAQDAMESASVRQAQQQLFDATGGNPFSRNLNMF